MVGSTRPWAPASGSTNLPHRTGASLALVFPAVARGGPDQILLAPELGVLSRRCRGRVVHSNAERLTISISSAARRSRSMARPTPNSSIFRGGEGLRDQVADHRRQARSSPASSGVRLHSACLTGDLFGSLKCDCGDQLRDTVALDGAERRRILLYLDQEGRGNGIANKITRLQAPVAGLRHL